jgi:hypothetical protein
MIDCSNGWRIVNLDEFTHFNLEPTLFGVFAVVSLQGIPAQQLASATSNLLDGDSRV